VAGDLVAGGRGGLHGWSAGRARRVSVECAALVVSECVAITHVLLRFACWGGVLFGSSKV
jgi:hypothetical protein